MLTNAHEHERGTRFMIIMMIMIIMIIIITDNAKEEVGRFVEYLV